LTTEGVATFLAGIDGQGTRRVYYVTMKAWSGWLVSTGRRPDDPMLMLPAPKVPRYEPRPITTRQLETVLRSRMHRRTRAMILLAAYAGLRVHEIAKVRGEDFDLDDMTLRVTGKGGKTATVPLHPVIAQVAESFPRRGWWFSAYTGELGHITGRGITTTVAKAMRRAGVDATAHCGRHWLGTELVRSGADLRTVQTILRHSSLATTAVYTAVADETRAVAVRGLPDATRGRLRLVPRHPDPAPLLCPPTGTGGELRCIP
jgi:site-specific recombinase XerD